jgi:PIN domain nuclease of toxin-antitoxin system
VTCVLDASALLAFVNDETGADRVAELLEQPAAMSAMNYAETLARLADDGEAPAEIAARLEHDGLVGGILRVEPATADDAPVIAELRRSTRHLGLSLADRACLALGLRLGVPVVTADCAWADLDVGVAIDVVR